MDAEVDACPLAGFHNLVLELFLDFCNHFLNACRVDTSVNHELMQGQTANFPSYRVEA